MNATGPLHSLAAWISRREKLNPDVIYDLAIFVFSGGIVGARSLYVVQNWGTQIQSVWDALKVWEGGIVLYGGVIGGAAAFFGYWRLSRFPLRPTLDAVAPALALGIALGRLGCFLHGCCFGTPCDHPWAIAFPRRSPAWLAELAAGQIGPEAVASLPVHPTQLYSALDGLVLLLLLLTYYPLRRRDGEVMALLMVAYPITRSLIDQLRGDEPARYGGLTLAPFLSVALLSAGLVYWAWLSRQPADRCMATTKSQGTGT